MKQRNNLPLVSVIITSYNRAGMIDKAIESALSQSYSNLEVIVSDNCSTDNSDEVIRKYISDKRLNYSRNVVNIGMIPNFRKATYELAKGEYITYISSDDYLIDNSFVTDAVKIVLKDPQIEIVHGRMAFNSTRSGVLWEMPAEPFFLKEVWDGKDVFFKSVQTELLSWGACLLKKSAMERVACLKSEYHNADLDANYKIMLGGKVGFINRLCYMQLGHLDNNGFPVNADKLVASLECFENVAQYAHSLLPHKAKEIDEWKSHFQLYTVKISFHSLYERNIKQYKLFKKKVKQIYPELYQRHIQSWNYKKMVLLSPIKWLVPQAVITKIRRIVGK